ncbi:ThuA domain-containing protein [Goodfellowiella coeruleoviolacea]|uniref:ThuA-like domain-containing protein n=1 Tax=Goodfellowiella coeruleoviolacea TaxID=334858 RepID=A0AAE3G9K8_9PSEU|nr:ThuA domain-containing protein [Goodfellowiella coeruleoviolacea]MCP2164176.1 hypothetical protein [Goodfellowiella coeruleoviolacea]
MTSRRALVVRGGWAGHQPRETTELFLPFLRDNGFDVHVSETLDAYTDADLMAGADLVVQCWSRDEISAEQAAGLITAVANGTGFAGWHGGIVGAFRNNLDYHRLTGGQFLAHPGGFIDHEVLICPNRTDHPIVRGFDRLVLHTEQYWVFSDAGNDVLATTTVAADADTPWHTPITVPAIWTRRWGAGRVFVSTIGHHVPDLVLPDVRTITERGLLWASRPARPAH